MLRLLAALIALALPAAAMAQTPEPAPVEVMVLGTYHMGNPGQDLHNAQVDSVMTPAKQAELEAVVAALARFEPTAIAIERVAPNQADMLDDVYPAFTPADLLTVPDERAQIGYRLAHRLGLGRVYAVDEQDRDGQPSYFPFEDVQSWAEANGRSDVLGALHARVEVMVADMETRQRTDSVASLLRSMNTPESASTNHAFYTAMLALGAGDAQPGAVLYGRWYTRNAMIFARLVQAAKPGDRIVIIYGAGHAYWLRQLVQTTPGFRLVEANDYLPVS